MIAEADKYPSRYFDFYLNEDDCIKIRVSNHSGRVANNREQKTLSFVLDKNVIHDCNMRSDEYIIDENGEFEEEFTSIEECIEWNL